MTVQSSVGLLATGHNYCSVLATLQVGDSSIGVANKSSIVDKLGSD